MLSLCLPQQRHGLFRPKAPYDLFLFLLLPLLPHRQHCFQGGDHGRSIGFPDPGSKPDLICLHGNSSLYDPGNLLLFFRCILRLIRDLDHIALPVPKGISTHMPGDSFPMSLSGILYWKGRSTFSWEISTMTFAYLPVIICLFPSRSLQSGLFHPWDILLP